MRHRTIRIAAILAASMAVGGCVGYGFPGDAGYPGGYGTQPYPPYQGGNTGRNFRCESHDKRMQRCNVDTRYGVSLMRRLSNAPCIQGQTWGWDAGGVWVDNGCRAEFTIGGGYGGPSYPTYPGGGYGQGRTVRCESNKSRYHRCNVPVYQGVQLQHKLSDASCKQGSDWGWDRNGIWVDDGCRADFLVF